MKGNQKRLTIRDICGIDHLKGNLECKINKDKIRSTINEKVETYKRTELLPIFIKTKTPPTERRLKEGVHKYVADLVYDLEQIHDLNKNVKEAVIKELERHYIK